MMRTHSPISIAMKLLRAFGGFTSSRSASAAVEFAIVLPVALVMYIGAAEVSDAVMTSRTLNQMTRTLVDLTSQQQTSTQSTSSPTPPNALSADKLSELMNATTSLLTGEPTDTLTLTISAIDVTNTSLGICCTAKVRWSYTQNGTLRPCNVPLQAGSPGTTGQYNTVPSGLMPYGSPLPAPMAILVADVGYTYRPVLGTAIMAIAPSMARNEYMFPRTTGQVITGALPSSGTQHGQICY